jgi:crotonobetainyl-CoA:carnitine CoA-transferase CaiB-like acyl-CoA transferase
VVHRAELRAELERRLGARPAAAWIADLTAAGVPAGQVNDIAGAFALAGRLGPDPVVELPGAGGAGARGVRNPIGLSATPPAYRSAPPPLPPRGVPAAWPEL